MSDLEFGIRLTADGSGLQGEGRAARAEIDNMRGSVDNLSKSAQGNRDAFKALDDQLASFMSKLSPAYNAVKQLDTGHDLLNRSLDAGLLTQKQYDDGIARLTAKYGPAAAGAAALSHGHGGLATNTAFATREIRALFDELSSGRDRQAIGTLTLLTMRMGGLGPAGLAALAGVVAVTGGLAIGIVHSETAARALAQVEAEFAATGRAGLLSGGQVKGLVDQLALLPGINRASAQQTVAALAAVPTLSGPIFRELAGLVDDFAFATGKKAPAAAQELARAMEDPLKGAQALDKQFNLLTADQELQIQSLVHQGRIYDAQALLLKTLEDRFKGLHDNALTPMQRATGALGNAWDSLMKSFGNSGAIQGATNALAGMLSTIAAIFNPASLMNPATQNRWGLGPAGSPAAAGPGAPGSAGAGGSWEQQHQAYLAGLEFEVKGALAVADAYRGVNTELRALREQRDLFRGAMIAAALTGDSNAAQRISTGALGNRLALSHITGTDPTSVQARIDQSALERANEESRANAAYASIELSQRHGIQQAGLGAIADPVARGQAQLDLEKRLRDESIASAQLETSAKERLLSQSNDFYMAQQIALNEHLKPQYQKNLDAWADNNRLMRENWAREMLTIQTVGEDAFVQFATTGKIQVKSLLTTIEAEFARSAYRNLVGDLLGKSKTSSSSSGSIVGSLAGLFGFGGSSSSGASGGGFDDFTGLYMHSGGVVGGGGNRTVRMPASMVAGARRFHTGLMPDEFPAILQSGETVLPRGAGSSVLQAPLNITLHAPGATSGTVTQMRSMLRDELPAALYQHRRTIVGLLNNHRRETGKGAL